MDDLLKTIERFHGHLGPYVVIGYKMGTIANKRLGFDPFEKTATVCTGKTPPVSCIIDGIQLSSGCTLGKGTITVKDELIPKAIFSNKKAESITITLHKEIQQEIKQTVTKENMIAYATELYARSDGDLFTIE